MTYGGSTYGGASLGSTSSADGEGTPTANAQATTTASTQATGTGAATSTAGPQTTTSTTTTSAGAAIANANAQASAQTLATDAESDLAPIQYRVTRDGTEVEDAVYDVDPLVDTANPFGDYAVVKIDDRGGEKFETYERGTRIDIAVSTNAGITFERRFTGYVVERRETEQGGADALEVEAYSFDQFLRRNTVTNDQTGNTITEALADIIQTDTPVSYVASNVEVGDDQELTRGYQGEAVENVLRDLAFKSNNENFGVNDSLEFFFRPRETVHIDRGIDNTQWFNYDIPELGKEAINEVEVWFNDGDESVIVDDGTDKLDLQDGLGLPEPGTQRHELNRPLITDIADAEDIGRKYLAFKNSTLSGTVTTFGLYDAEPGDTIDITIDPRGIDEEFVIAGIEYRWGVDQTILTIVEKRGDVDDILSELNDSVQRVEMEGANRDAPSNRITTTNATAIIDVSADADGNTPSDVRFVNDGRRKVRDGWADKGYPAISNLVVGDDGSGLSRSNDTLTNQVASVAVSENLPDSTSVEYSATVTQTSVEELGLETSDGTLMCRLVFDSPVDLDGSVTVTLAVSNDDSVSRGVLTSDGQTAVRDVLADNSPSVPTDYAYGSDGTAVAESDSALGNEVVEVSLENILIQDADTTSEWEGIVDTGGDSVPLQIASGALETTQICFTTEGENFDNGQTGFDNTSDTGQYSGGDYWNGTRGPNANGPDFAEWEFTPTTTIPASDFGLQLRDACPVGDGTPAVNFQIVTPSGDAYLVDSLNLGTGLSSSVDWHDPLTNPYQGGTPNLPNEFTKGETYTFRVEVTDSDGVSNQYQYNIDVVAPYDARRESDLTFDNTVNTSGGALNGPERFPALVETALATASTRRNVTEANFTSTWNNTANQQYIEIANDGSTFTRFDNSDTGSVTFASPESGVDTNLGLSRFASDTTSTPATGDSGQSVDAWELFANPDATVSDSISSTLSRGIVPPNTISGQTIREAGLKSNGTLLTRHEIAAFEVLQDQRLASAETSTFTGSN